MAVETGLVRARSKKAVRLLAGKYGVDPLAGFLDDLLVIQHVAEVAITFEPVRQLLPAELPLPVRRSPCAVFELAPFRNLLEMTSHSVGFEFELVPQPALGLDAADG